MKRLLKLITLWAIFSLWLASAMAQDQRELSPSDAARVESLLQTMTLEEKAGQLFMVSLYGRELTEAGKNLIRDYHPGAVALFSYNTDFEPASRVAYLINQMQSAASNSGAGVPMIIAVDHEGGRVRRIVNDVTRFPDPLFMGAITQPHTIEHIGELTGRELRALGVNMNLAPVADLYSPGDLTDKNRVLNRRTFGDDPQRVGEATAAYGTGLNAGGVISVTKHFPGHGGAIDSHRTLPEVATPATQARQTALYPFEIAVQAGTPAIMVGHLYYSELEPEERLPASLSPTLNGILRDDFGFDGVVMTDALDMNAITQNYAIPQAALMAINAGVDMIVLGPNVSWETQRRSIQTLIDAVQTGEISQERLDTSVRRVLRLKAAYGILDWVEQDPNTVTENIDLPATEAALTQAYMDAATLLRDDSGLLPLALDDDVAIVYPARYQKIYDTCLGITRDVRYYGYTFEPLDSEYNVTASMGIDHAKVVIFVEDVYKYLRQRDLVRVLPPERTIIVTLGTPTDHALFPTYSTHLAMYNSLPASYAAACNVLFGQHPISGQLPIHLDGYPSGTGISIHD